MGPIEWPNPKPSKPWGIFVAKVTLAHHVLEAAPHVASRLPEGTAGAIKSQMRMFPKMVVPNNYWFSY